MKYVTCDNTLYGMSDRKFLEYLEQVGKGVLNVDITEYGKVHGEPVVVDGLTAEEAKTLLAESSKDSEAAKLGKQKASMEKRIADLQAKLEAMSGEPGTGSTEGGDDPEDMDLAVGE